MTPSEFKQIYPEFAQVPDLLVQHAITSSSALVNETTWGHLFEPALFSLVAHSLAVRQDSQLKTAANLLALDTGTSLKSESSLSYYQRSGYGEEFLALKKRLPVIGGSLRGL